MEIWLNLLLAKIIIIILLLYSKIYIAFTYQRNGSKDYIAVRVYAFRKLLSYSMEIPMIKLTYKDASIWLVSKIKAGNGQNQTESNREKRFVKNAIRLYVKNPGKLRHLLKVFRRYSHLYTYITEKVIGKFYCEQLEWKTVCGSEDAALSSIGTGALWTLKGFILTRLKRQIVFNKKPTLSIDTKYGENYLSVDLQCIFSIRIGNVINAMRSIYVIKR